MAKWVWVAIARDFYDGYDETCIFELNQRSILVDVIDVLEWCSGYILEDRLQNYSQEGIVEGGAVVLHQPWETLIPYLLKWTWSNL